MRSVPTGVLLSLLSLIASCSGDAGLELAVDLRTDLRGDLEFDEVLVELQFVGEATRDTIRGPDTLRAFATDDFVSGRRLAEYSDLSAGTYAVRVLLTLEGGVVASRIVERSISSDTGIIVLIVRSCVDVTCPAGQTCIGGRCVAPTCGGLDEPGCGPEECRLDAHCTPNALCASFECRGGACFYGPDDNACLPGQICHAERGCLQSATDGGVPFDGCVPTAETCNAADDDCDGSADEDFDTRTDPDNCGSCGAACSTMGGTATCSAGACGVACGLGTADCDSDAANGCETDVTTAMNCGACGSSCGSAEPRCVPESGTFLCAASCPAAAPMACGTSCVDTATSALHCGSCDQACRPDRATGTCVAGSCEVASCDSGFGDCNGVAADGCEQSLGSVDSCGACGVACSRPNGVTSCTGGTCRLVACDPGWGDCNSVESDGCETHLNGDANCGGCGVTCTGIESCSGGTCATSPCVTNPSAWGLCREGGDDAEATCGAFRIFCDGDCVCFGPTSTIECDIGGIADECTDVEDAIDGLCCGP